MDEKVNKMIDKELDNIVEDLIKIRKKAREIQEFAIDIADKTDEIRKIYMSKKSTRAD